MPIFSRFGADFFTVYADFSRFVREINGEKKNISLSMSFFTVSFSRFAPSRIRTKSVGKRPINEGKRPIKAKVLVGVSVGSLMGCFRAPPPQRKTAPLKRPFKRCMKICRQVSGNFLLLSAIRELLQKGSAERGFPDLF